MYGLDKTYFSLLQGFYLNLQVVFFYFRKLEVNGVAGPEVEEVDGVTTEKNLVIVDCFASLCFSS